MDNKKVKRMISSATGGEWVNDAVMLDKPVLWFFGKGGIVLAREYHFYHRVISIKAIEIKK